MRLFRRAKTAIDDALSGLGSLDAPAPHSARAVLRNLSTLVICCGLSVACVGDTTDAGRPSALGGDGGNDVGPDDDGWPPPTTGVFTTGPGETEGEGDEDPGPPPMPPDLGACSNDEECMFEGEDDTCFITQGTCEFGQCFFDAASPGTACDDGDPCTEGDVCNGMGGCLGEPIVCTVEHGMGTCIDDGCGAPLECDAGWSDCDADPSNGCEAQLGTNDHCGGCNMPCTAGPHTESASCEDNACVVTCEDPWEDCNGDAADGCEIPTGIPNQCDADGLNPDNGCWTAHCGNSSNADAVNFDSWFCFECTNCRVVGETDCQWCSHSTGRGFPTNSCSCEDDPTDCLCVVDEVNYLELVCAP